MIENSNRIDMNRLWENFPIILTTRWKTCTDYVEVGHTGPLRPSDMGRPIPHLERVLLDFPELVVVGGHIGAPWLDEMIFLANKCSG